MRESDSDTVISLDTTPHLGGQYVGMIEAWFKEWKIWWKSRSLQTKAIPLLTVSLYWILLLLAHGMREDHLLIGACLLVLHCSGPKLRSFYHFCLPFLLTAVIYDSQRFYSHLIRGEIHVEFPYFFDKAFFGIVSNERILTPGEWLQRHLHPILDLVTGFAYLVFFLQYIGVSAYFNFWLGRRGSQDLPPSEIKVQAQKMTWAFLWLNILGYSTYYWFPAAPPWYVSQYGLGPALVDTPANPAGCLRFDQILGTHFFSGMYGRSADVFGAIPSLHVAYPLLAAFYAFQLGSLRVFTFGFYVWMCFSAVYLNHHYILDILWGSTYALLIGFAFNRISFSKKALSRWSKRLSVYSLILFLTSLAFFHLCFGANCFDFSKKITDPIDHRLPLNENMDLTAKGETNQHIRWGALRAVIESPIQYVVQKLLDPRTIKGSENKDVEVTDVKRPGYLAFRIVKMTVRPFLFVTISWNEEWAYTLLNGTEKNPDTILISYQKTSGSSHLEHFCGSIIIKKLTNQKCDISIYEEIKAARRSSQDIVDGHLGTLRALRK